MIGGETTGTDGGRRVLRGFAVEDAAARAIAAQAASYEPAERYVLFELKLSEGAP